VSSGQEFLNDQERDILTSEKLLEQARATRDIAQLATALGLADEQTAGLVGAFRLRAEQFDMTTLETIRQHAAGLRVALGDTVLHVSIEKQSVVDTTTIDNALAVEQPAQASCASEEATITPHEAATLAETMTLEAADEAIERVGSSIDLNPSTARFLRDIFGDYSEFNLQETDKPLIVNALMALRAMTTQTPKALELSAKVRTRFGMKLAGASNQTIADFEGSRVHDIESALSQLKRRMRNNYDTLDERRGILREALRQETAAIVHSTVSEPVLRPVIVHDAQEPVSAISYVPTVPNKPRADEIPPRREKVCASAQPDFDRLKAAIYVALGDNATLFDTNMTIDDLAPTIQTAYEQEFGSADSDEFAQCYLAMLRAEDRPRDLFKQCTMEPAKISRAMRAMPGLIAAVLRGDNHAPMGESVATSPVVTPRHMPTRQQPLHYTPRVRLSDEEWAARQAAIASVEGETSRQEPAVPTGEVAEVTVVTPEVDTTPRQLLDCDLRTHDDLREVTLTIIKDLHDFTDDEKKALRARSFFGKHRAHADMTSDTLIAIRKVRDRINERGDEICLPSELTEQTLKYFVLGDHYDLDAIYKKLQSSYSEIKIDPRDIERWLGLGLEALFPAEVQPAIS
jgi:hypothetical protein